MASIESDDEFSQHEKKWKIQEENTALLAKYVVGMTVEEARRQYPNVTFRYASPVMTADYCPSRLTIETGPYPPGTTRIDLNKPRPENGAEYILSAQQG